MAWVKSRNFGVRSDFEQALYFIAVLPWAGHLGGTCWAPGKGFQGQPLEDCPRLACSPWALIWYQQ